MFRQIYVLRQEQYITLSTIILPANAFIVYICIRLCPYNTRIHPNGVIYSPFLIAFN
jgi:hypothetical protein